MNKAIDRENEVEEFDESLVLAIDTDVCCFCRKGHSTGVEMEKRLGFSHEIDDGDEEIDVISSSENMTLNGQEFSQNREWISVYSIKRGNKRTFVHFYCALFGPLTWYDGQNWYNIRKEIHRSNGLMCKYCKVRGATLGCCEPRCKVVVHIPCALEHGYLPQRAINSKSYYCEEHLEALQSADQKKVASQMKDFSRGREPVAIEFDFNNDHEDVFNDFEYITENLDSNDAILSPNSVRDWPCCDCDGLCDDVTVCACLAASQRNYTMHGILIPGNSNPILECNLKCNCSYRRCTNRVVGKGIQYKFKLINYSSTKQSSAGKKRRLNQNSYGVITLNKIPAGALICEVIGQYVLGKSQILYRASDDSIKGEGTVTESLLKQEKTLAPRIHIVDAWENADMLSDNIFARSLAFEYTQSIIDRNKSLSGDYEIAYFPDPDIETDGSETPSVEAVNILNQTICLDCRFYGNISRFFRKRNPGSEPMVIRKVVYSLFGKSRYPRLALFAATDIPANSEILV